MQTLSRAGDAPPQLQAPAAGLKLYPSGQKPQEFSLKVTLSNSATLKLPTQNIPASHKPALALNSGTAQARL